MILSSHHINQMMLTMTLASLLLQDDAKKDGQADFLVLIPAHKMHFTKMKIENCVSDQDVQIRDMIPPHIPHITEVQLDIEGTS